MLSPREIDMPRQCEAIHPTTHVRCGFPEGHRYLHGNGTLTTSWDDLEPTVDDVKPDAVAEASESD
jgi:hypothetical protein